MPIYKILNPNCSELVFRLDRGSKLEIGTDSYPNGFVDYLIANKDKFQEKPNIEWIENNGGGGDIGYVLNTLKVFEDFKKGKITEEEFKKLDKDLWEQEGEESKVILHDRDLVVAKDDKKNLHFFKLEELPRIKAETITKIRENLIMLWEEGKWDKEVVKAREIKDKEQIEKLKIKVLFAKL